MHPTDQGDETEGLSSSLLFGTAKTFELLANFEYENPHSSKIELYPRYPKLRSIDRSVIGPFASFVHGHIDVMQNRLWMLWDVLQSVIVYVLPLVSFGRGKSLYAVRTRLFRLTCINTQNGALSAPPPPVSWTL